MYRDFIDSLGIYVDTWFFDFKSFKIEYVINMLEYVINMLLKITK